MIKLEMMKPVEMMNRTIGIQASGYISMILNTIFHVIKKDNNWNKLAREEEKGLVKIKVNDNNLHCYHEVHTSLATAAQLSSAIIWYRVKKATSKFEK